MLNCTTLILKQHEVAFISLAFLKLLNPNGTACIYIYVGTYIYVLGH